MADDNREKQAEYLRDYWDTQSKAVGFMLTAHGVAFVSCLAFLKDYKATESLRGVGAVIVLAAAGLIFGSLSYGGLVGCRALQIKNALEVPTRDHAIFFRIYVVLCILCYLLFVVEVVVVAYRLHRL